LSLSWHRRSYLGLWRDRGRRGALLCRSRSTVWWRWRCPVLHSRGELAEGVECALECLR
jgi:hypothetical protein